MSALHLSIVSHLQAGLVEKLLGDIALHAGSRDWTVTVLSNLPEAPPAIPPALAGRVEHLVNDRPKGFGANHNSVFQRCRAPFFCVLNPDLRLPSDPFPALLAALADESVAVAAPSALDPQGALQDNARKLPTPFKILQRRLSRGRRDPDYRAGATPVPVDWVAGFFMLVRSSAFRDAGGFDERYFLYYEDVDLCSRLRLAGRRIAWVPQASVVHDARRHSHRVAKYLAWHLRSSARFFTSPVYRAARKLGPEHARLQGKSPT